MIYNTSIEHQKKQAITRFEHLVNKGKVLELKEKQPQRSLSQNRYLHLLFGAYGIETGLPIDYVKQVIFKQLVNPNAFKSDAVNKRTGELVTVWRSTADLDKAEMTLCITRFKDHAMIELGIYLPNPDDLVALLEIERQMEINKEYL